MNTTPGGPRMHTLVPGHLVYRKGTTLGHLLFLAYIYNIPHAVRSSKARLFADDSLLYRNIFKPGQSGIAATGPEAIGGLGEYVANVPLPEPVPHILNRFKQAKESFPNNVFPPRATARSRNPQQIR